MLNKDEIEHSIRTQIVEPLEKAFNGDESSVNWYSIDSSIHCFRSYSETEPLLHEALKHLYFEHLCHNMETGRISYIIYDSMSKYNDLGKWIGQTDIMDIVEHLLRKTNPANRFFKAIDILLEHGYAPYIKNWDQSKIENEIERLAVQDDRKRGELFCVMQAYHSIATYEDLSDSDRMAMYLLIRDHWQYLVNVYSVMVKRIVGSNFKNFNQIANNVIIMPSSHPFIHLFYDALFLRQNDIFHSEDEKKKAVKHMGRIEEIIKNTTQDDDLDDLCKILFGKEFEDVLSRKNVMTYDEMQKELKDCRDAMNTMLMNWNMVVNKLKAAVEASVPISVIEKELLRLEPNIAIGIFSQLNTLLIGEKSWTKYANELKNKILEKRDISVAKANITIGAVDRFENNGTYNDFDGANVFPYNPDPAAKQIPLNPVINQ